MLHFLIKKPINLLMIKVRSNLTHISLLHNSISKTVEVEEEEKPIQNRTTSLTISYLVNSCGLSPQSAHSISKKIQLKTTENSESVLNTLKSYGFTDTHIATILCKVPSLLSSDSDKIVRPKLEFFLNIGFSSTQLIKIISLYPNLLNSSLEKRLQVNFYLLSSVIQNKQQIAIAILRNSRLLQTNLETNFLPNVNTLQSFGVPTANIAKLFTCYPRSITRATVEFAKAVETVKKFGFDPLSIMFVQGVSVMSGMTLSAWERKMGVYKSLGLSEEEIISAFKKHPKCMLMSSEKIRRGMDFFMKTMHWGSSFLSERPVVLSLSLEKRIIPRCLVLNVLASKGLVTKNLSAKFLFIGEEDFLNKYVIKYQDRVPEVIQAYNGNSASVGLKGVSMIIDHS